MAEYDRLEEYKANTAMVEEQALDYELPAELYIKLLQIGTPLVEVIKQMKKDRDAAIERKHKLKPNKKRKRHA